MDNDDFDYNPGHDKIAKKDGGPKQDFRNGMLARLERLEKSSTGQAINIMCWFGVICLTVAALNLLLGRPWF
jgi:hypothetical protein